MSYDTPLTASGQALTDLPWREQVCRGFKDMGARSLSSARNFGIVGAVFAGTECGIEAVRLSVWPFSHISYDICCFLGLFFGPWRAAKRDGLWGGKGGRGN